MTPEERRSKQRENQNFFSEKLSELSRYIAFGVIAVYFTVLSSDGKFYELIRSNAASFIRLAVVLAILVILLDFIQMVCGLASSTLAAENKDGEFRKTLSGDILSYFQKWSFYLKNFLCVASSVALLIGVAKVSFA